MRDTTIICDRCRAIVTDGVSVVEIAAGMLRKRRGPESLDLCGPCAESFAAWLAEGPATLPSLEPAEASAVEA